MHFASDNAGPAHPAILEALAEANEGYAKGYGNDDLTRAVEARVREVFEAPRAAVHLVATGTAANTLLLATLAQPWEAIFCTAESHIAEDECNGVEAASGGASLSHVPSEDGKMSAEVLADVLGARASGVHAPQRGPVSITSVTERGSVYTLEEIAAITDVARVYGLKTHLDGARFANAMEVLGCSAAEMSWKAGIDAVSFGGTKNGCLGVEACVLFDPEQSWELELRRKRAGHLFSKHRLLAAQMQGYLADDLWRDLAARANRAAARLKAGIVEAGHGDTLLGATPANMLFVRWPRRLHRALREAGAVYYLMDGELEGDDATPLTGRLVCDWSMTDARVDAFLALLPR
ncbi:L-threonine aldolase, low-specificity, putative [Oceanicola granulosus HTCC2516]|uniref:L-threonine aldolase, low-specificity, putative n=1 Tax=Oceanicola granulosus (strain ATCC BAA-861 / DSM 15982 / KCTC 12143 / HTCC2516) TaxID=314256 RepID=Q2CFM5_OCEGH|nr:beta-eliminating lyase-related protein [Oceanicola granulosus]EAR51457.1 L-threonine aldolase, low-specificity, putative [Oceanicola granulosus HTCC2516]